MSYIDMYLIMKHFVYLETIDLSSIVFRSADRIVTSCRDYQRPLKLLVGSDQYGITQHNIKHLSCKNVVLNVLNKKRKRDEDDEKAQDIEPQYVLGKTIKHAYQQIAHFKYTSAFEYVFKNKIASMAFLKYRVSHLKFTGTTISYTDMYLVVRHFVYLETIDVSNIVFRYANRIAEICRDYQKPLRLLVGGDQFTSLQQNINHLKCKNVVLDVPSLKRKRDIDDEMQRDIERKEEELRMFKEHVHQIATTDNSIEERLLQTFGVARKYAYNHQQKTKPINDLESLNAAVNDLGSKYVESVLLTVEGKFVLVTQVEIYYKQKNLDSSANLMIKCLDDVHKIKPVVSMDIKNEGNGGWFELGIFFDKFELLVTGGVIGSVNDGRISGFLGSSRAPEALLSQQEWIILSLVQPAEPFQKTRLLRNYQKKASLYRWSFKSQSFC